MNRPVYIQRMAGIHPTETGEQPYLTAHEPDYKAAVPYPAARRRMSRIIKMGVACGLQCLQGIAPEEVGALITATGLGCLGDTEKFLEALVRQHEDMLNPTPFIQSTFNTIGGQIALLLHIQSYNVTYVHRGLSFENALLDGIMHVNEGHDHVLVEAVDEMTPTLFALLQRLGMTRWNRPGEGAHAFLLGREQTDETMAVLLGCAPFTRIDETPPERYERQLADFLSAHQLSTTDIKIGISGRSANPEEESFYQAVRKVLPPCTPELTFKTACGEYPTASAYGMYQAIEQLRQAQSGNTVLVSNMYAGGQYSFTLLQCP